MKLRLLALTLATIPLMSCASNSSTPAGGSGNATADSAAMQTVVDHYMQPFLATNKAYGAIVGISVHGTRSYYSYGTATNAGAQFTPVTLVEIGSCTKVFTTTLFALAVSRGQMQPEVPAQTYMPPGYTLKGHDITPLQLADFLSGMPDEIPRLPIPRPDIQVYTSHDFLDWASSFVPKLPTSYEYSNPSVGLLAYLIQQATGTAWETQINSEIVGPLGMVDTEESPTPEQMKRMAQGHLASGFDAPPWPIYAWFGAGVLRSTPRDMLSFGEANLGHTSVNGHAVSPELIAAMQSAQAPVYSMTNGNGQGMAWVTNRQDGTGTDYEILKNGGTSGFSTVILTNPTTDTAIFIAVNQGSDEADGDLANPAAVAVEIGRHLPQVQ